MRGISEQPQNAHIAQPESSAAVGDPVFTTATAIKHGAVALGLLADSPIFDLDRLGIEADGVDYDDAIDKISRSIEGQAEAILAGVDPAQCLKTIEAELKRLFVIADDDQVDWGMQASLKFVGRAIERDAAALKPGC